ncbi:MAG: hypothetical protein IPK05_19620 [Comamonadaceae bacterium]|nr:hypothetical protein [Comamonadaceae bacterium]
MKNHRHDGLAAATKPQEAPERRLAGKRRVELGGHGGPPVPQGADLRFQGSLFRRHGLETSSPPDHCQVRAQKRLLDLNRLQRTLKPPSIQTAADLREDDEIEAVQLVQQVVDGLGRAQGAVHTRQRQCGGATGGG